MNLLYFLDVFFYSWFTSGAQTETWANASWGHCWQRVPWRFFKQKVLAFFCRACVLWSSSVTEQWLKAVSIPWRWQGCRVRGADSQSCSHWISRTWHLPLRVRFFPAQATKLFLRSVAVGSKTSLNKLGAKSCYFFLASPSLDDGNLSNSFGWGLKKNSWSRSNLPGWFRQFSKKNLLESSS